MDSFLFSPCVFFPPSCSSGEAREQSEGFGQTHHAHEWNTRHWWLHRAEIRLPSITSLERLVMKDRISRSGSYSTLLYSVWTLFCSFFFCVTKYCGSAAKFPSTWTVASHQSECPKDIKQQMSCHAAAGPYVFQQATVIFSILSCALGFKNHFVYTVRGRQKADPCAPANPSQTIISEAFARWARLRRIRHVWASSSPSPHKALIYKPSAVIWGMFSTHFMDIYVPALWRLCYF